MPLTRLPADVALDIVSLLPLSAIARLSGVQKAWQNFVASNQSNIYHNAAAQHRFIPSAGTSLEDAILSLDFNAVAFKVTGWKQFCALRLTVEKNWNGMGSSQMKKRVVPGDNVSYQRPIPDSEYTIVSSIFGGIAVFNGPKTIWALPPDYLEEATMFAYDRGYLVFVRRIRDMQTVLEVWHDSSPGPSDSTYKPSVPQKVTAETIASLYGPAAAGHFLPCYIIPAPTTADGRDDVNVGSIRLLYSTLLVTTSNEIHMWDVETGAHIRKLNTRKHLHDHSMNDLAGVELSQDYILAFDVAQIRLFSRHDGNFLLHFSTSTAFLPSTPGVQLVPPRIKTDAAPWDGTPLQSQVLFPKRRKWAFARGPFLQVGISACGTTLVAATENSRILIIPELHRMVAENIPIDEAGVEVKIASEYLGPRCISPAVTRDRVAIGTYRGILILTIDRSGAATTGSTPICIPPAVLSDVHLSASFVNFGRQAQDSGLYISGTKLFFTAEPTTQLAPILKRNFKQPSRRAVVNPAPRIVPAANIPHADGAQTDHQPADQLHG
ncbi:hypothetical protein C8R43DRAFT_984454 [Mycena crocata]|nr:hypothetical protein C8R43DRAFT_984454 [Mycena crocata]